MCSFICCWFPYACVSIAEAAGYTPSSTRSFYVLAIPTMLSKTTVCVDPIIYFWLNPQVTTMFTGSVTIDPPFNKIRLQGFLIVD